MPLKVLNASGYLSGGASEDRGVTILSITALPNAATSGSYKIDQGINGADKSVVALVEVLAGAGRGPWTIYLKKPILSSLRTYVTLVNCKVVIEYA